MTEFFVGQELWFVSARNARSEHAVTIEKVGRKWLEVGRGLRLDKETLDADGAGYSSPGKAYLTKEAWQAIRSMRERWDRFRYIVAHTHLPPKHLTEADVAAMIATLEPTP